MKEITLRNSIEMAIATEKLGAGFYGKLAEKFKSDKEISELFSILAKDEKAHEVQFRTLLDKVPAEDKEPTTDQKYQYLTAVSISEFFAGDGGALKDVDKIKTRDDALARAFAYGPALLVLDEATSSVDPETERLIQDSIHRLARRQTTLIVAHRPSTIQMADKIVVMYHGRIVEEGTHEELMALGNIYGKLNRLHEKNHGTPDLR